MTRRGPSRGCLAPPLQQSVGTRLLFDSYTLILLTLVHAAQENVLVEKGTAG